MNCHAALLLTATAAMAPAQTVSLSSLVPITAQVSVNGQVQTRVEPAGPIASGGLGVQAVLASATGSAMTWLRVSNTVAPTGVYFTLEQVANTEATSPVSASLSTGVFLMQLANPTPVAARLELSRSITPSSGAIESLRVDVGNDGTIEFTESSPSPAMSLLVTLGPTPLLVRIENQLTLPGVANAHSGLSMSVVPTAGITAMPAILGCDPGHQEVLLPTFTGNLRVVVIGPLMHSNPRVAVLGLGVQPIRLPSALAFPCLLLPSPDLLVFLANAQSFELALPAAVRPVWFWTQAVVLDPAGLQTTNGFHVAVQ